LRVELEQRGARFVPTDELEAFLRERRIRYTDSLAADDAHAIGGATGANFVIAGALLDYVPGSTPRVALALRALDAASGARVLSKVVSLRGEDFEGLLGLGRIEAVEPLCDEAARALLAEFDEHGAPAARTSRRATAHGPDGGSSFIADEFDPAAAGTIAVLPLENRTGRGEAAAYFAEFLGDAWFRTSGAQVVETAELRRALVQQGIRSMQFVDLPQLCSVGRVLGVRYFALGSLDRWGHEVTVDGRRYPQVQVALRLIDVESGRMVAAASVVRRGDQYQTILELGAVRDPLELARRTAAEIVAALGG
jgi:hypothetical protein